MARKPAIENPEHFFHVTSQCINREWFTDLEDTWQIFQQQLWLVKHGFGIEIYSFVMMSNHFHLLVRAPEGNLSMAMRYFLGESSRQIQKTAGRQHQIFAERFKRCEIGSYHYFLNTYKYIYQNPIRAGIVSTVEQYPFSTLHGLIGLAPLLIPITNDVLLFEDLEEGLNWLNTRPAKENERAVQQALRRRIFTLPKANKRRHPLEFNTL